MRALLSTIRVRATGASVVVLIIAFTIAGIVLLDVVHTSQIDTVDTALELRANDIGSLIDEGGRVDPSAVVDDEDDFIQVIDGAGNVVAASDNIEGYPPITAGGDDSTGTMRIPGLDHEEFRVHIHDTDNDELVIVVGTNLENVNEVYAATRRSLLVGMPILIGLIAAMIWFVIGLALRPVEAIRSEVADIGGGDLDRRVPEPKTNDEIGRLARTMNAMLVRLEASNIAQARFVSDASHELRTPIAVIRHELEVGLLSNDDGQLRQIAAEVLDEDLRMQRLIDDLLLLARRAGRDGETPPLKRSLVDLDDVALTEAHRVRTDTTIDTSRISAGQVRGDTEQLARVVRNLLDNALRHATSTVNVSVSSTNDGRVLLAIDDDGAGIADVDREHIFERFGRLDEARARDGGGSGLGLAIVAGLIADHGGTITVDASPTLGGARFTITLTDARA